MGYWLFMTLMCLLIPGILIGFGSIFVKNAPGSINSLYGYRTSMSMKNKDTWEFANTLWGKLAVKLGLAMLVISLIVMLAVLFAGEAAVSLAGTVLMVLQLIPIIATIPIVEKALNREFDKYGNRRKENGNV